jgi:hypothetical protein
VILNLNFYYFFFYLANVIFFFFCIYKYLYNSNAELVGLEGMVV